MKVDKGVPRPKYECDKCKRPFPSLLDLEEHMKHEHGASTTSVAG